MGIIKKIAALLVLAVILVVFYVQTPMFGKRPSGERLSRIEKSPNYVDGSFRNLEETSITLSCPLKTGFKFFFKNRKGQRPSVPLPTIKTDLKNLDRDENVLIWFGHSSYFIQLSGKRILVDPLFSEVSSPFPFFPRVFAGTNVYNAEDMPEIDCLIITHDHWDHLDYETVLKLKSKVKKIVCPLGVGSHFEYWGFDKNIIVETDWDESVSIDKYLIVRCLPARHFSGRRFSRNKTLWASFLIETPTFKIYVGGDGGYGAHFAKIGEKFGPIDLVALDCGQHNKNWPLIHMSIKEATKAAKDLRATALLPVHICKLCLANHPWNEPLEELSELSKDASFELLTPMIGEKVKLKTPFERFKKWWKNL
ncbi:MAG: MBL fold metallo-hydrolase [Holosporaceae bacterium]|nr:MBL fold metallo-hydrolase [Holosporaceae bacterium]